MHTSEALGSDDFQIACDGRAATLGDVLPGFDEHTRLGIVISEDQGGAGASALILAAVTGFYDRLRAAGGGFFAYADYFAFHVGSHRGTLRKLDVFPEHKEPVVADDGETILRAVNDRAITHLLVPDRRPCGELEFQRETLHSARRRLRGAIAYSPTGDVADADVRITANATAEGYVTAMIGRPRDRPAPPTETYRRLQVDRALRMLATTAQ